MKKEIFLAALLFIFISLIFFFPVFKGFVPFPGDLLVGEYAPYNSYSFLGYLPGGFPNKGQDFDVLNLLYPAKDFSIRTLKNFQIPLWNPYNFSGNPHLASLQSGAFYPFNILFFLLPSASSWTFYVFAQPVLAALFTFLLLREFGLNKKGAFFGGLVFAFSSFLVVWMEYGTMIHSIIWLPLIMWLSYKNLRNLTLLKSVAIVLFLTIAILAGHIQLMFYFFFFLFSFILFLILFIQQKNKIKNLLLFTALFFLSLMLSAIQLFPSIELFYNSSRSAYSLSSMIKLLIPQFHTVTAFAPDFFGNPATRNYWLSGTYIERVLYIGVMPLFFLIFGLIKKRSTLMWFFISTIILTYLLTFDSFFARFFYSFQLPFISTGVPSRMMYLFCFAASVLAAFGLDNFERNFDSKKTFKAAFIIVVIYTFIWLFTLFAPLILPNTDWSSNLGISKRNLLLPTAILGFGLISIIFSFKSNLVKRYLFIILLAITIFDLYYFFQKITPFSPKESIYPKTQILEYLKKIQGIDRSWGYGSAYINANIQTYEKIFSTNGYDALHIKRYGELLSSSKNGNISESVPRSEADIISGFGEEDLRQNFYRQRLLNLLGVKYVLNKIIAQEGLTPDYKTFNSSIYKLIWQKGMWQIYENKESLPRIFFASNYIVSKNNQDIIRKIYDKNFNLKENLILEEKLSSKLSKDKNAKIDLVSYTGNKILINTKSEANMLLFISDSYFPGWHAAVDGRETKIYRTNYSFRSILVREGKHKIFFWYSPASFDLGLKVSVITFSVIICLSIIGVYKRRKYAGN